MRPPDRCWPEFRFNRPRTAALENKTPTPIRANNGGRQSLRDIAEFAAHTAIARAMTKPFVRRMAGDIPLDLSRARRHEVSLGTVSFDTRNLNPGA